MSGLGRLRPFAFHGALQIARLSRRTRSEQTRDVGRGMARLGQNRARVFAETRRRQTVFAHSPMKCVRHFGAPNRSLARMLLALEKADIAEVWVGE
jgi:hypothetical protein